MDNSFCGNVPECGHRLGNGIRVKDVYESGRHWPAGVMVFRHSNAMEGEAIKITVARSTLIITVKAGRDWVVAGTIRLGSKRPMKIPKKERTSRLRSKHSAYSLEDSEGNQDKATNFWFAIRIVCHSFGCCVRLCRGYVALSDILREIQKSVRNSAQQLHD
jgi:hypothetical protein